MLGGDVGFWEVVLGGVRGPQRLPSLSITQPGPSRKSQPARPTACTQCIMQGNTAVMLWQSVTMMMTTSCMQFPCRLHAACQPIIWPAAPLKVTSGSCGNRGLSLCRPTSTTSGTEWRRAASATMWEPDGATTPPLASTACAPTSTCGWQELELGFESSAQG